MKYQRRTFMKLGAQVIGGLSVIRYADAFEVIPESRKWIEEREDFYIVRVPDGKTFADEVLNKPTIFIMGDDAKVLRTTVNAYVNFAYGKAALISQCVFDIKNFRMDGRNVAVMLRGESGLMENCSITNMAPNPIGAMYEYPSALELS